MIQQIVEIVSTTLLLALALGALSAAVPSMGGGQKGRKPGYRSIIWGALAGVALGGVLTIVHLLIPRQINRQDITFWALIPTVILAAVTLVMVWRVRGRARKGVEASSTQRRAALWVAAAYAAMATFRVAPTALLQIRTFVSPNTSLVSTDTVKNIVGYLIGVALVALLAVGVRKLCERGALLAPIMSTVGGGILTLTHVILIVRILQAKRIIHLPGAIFESIAWTINHEDAITLVATALVAVASILVWIRSRSLPKDGPNPAVRRLRLAEAKSWRRLSAGSLLACAAAGAVLTIGAAISSATVELSQPEPFEVSGDQAVVQLDKVSDGHLHRFAYTTSTGIEVRFIVIQKAGSSFGVGLDACEICGPTGYYEKDGKVICKLCEVAMNIATIGFKGGCNPIPIDYEVSNGTLSVPIAQLEAAASVFA